MIPVECIARGYLAGLGLAEYQKSGTVSGVPLPGGLVEGSKLPQTVFTPTTKAPGGQHDEFITLGEAAELLGEQTAERLRDLTIRVYDRCAAIAAERGIIVADTKFEFGRAPDGTITLADEIITPDSSRFWPADRWAPGGPQFAFDKQMVRDWAGATGWDKSDPGPAIPEDVVRTTRTRYVEAYQRLTGLTWVPAAG